jgi:hypothetical protein
LTVWNWLRRKPVAPPPKSAATQQSDQNDANDCYPDGPTNRKFRDQEKDDQENDAGDYEYGCEAHVLVVCSSESVVIGRNQANHLSTA